jgi:hypothetical protein
MATVQLSARDLDLLERGLGDLLYLPESEPALASPARELLARLRAAEAQLAGGATARWRHSATIPARCHPERSEGSGKRAPLCVKGWRSLLKQGW